MKDPEPSRVEELFLSALDVPDDELDVFLARECAGDEALAARVKRLIALDRAPDVPLDGIGRRVAAHTGEPAPGEMIDGKYRVERVLGRGGMGIVVAARNVDLDDRVALKFLAPHVLLGEHAVSRVAREARIAAKLKSEHVVRVFDVRVPSKGAPAGERAYIVMELLEGRDLAAVLRDSGPMPARTAIEHALHACEALAEAHRVGVVHRDLKPQNLFLAERLGQAAALKVLDFGISKLAALEDDEGTGPVSRAGDLGLSDWLGSPRYMSPEQVQRDAHVDRRTDVWSLGVVLFEMLSGRAPFDGPDAATILRSIRDDDPPFDALPSDVPAELGSVLRRCLAKDPAERFSTMGELALALVPFAPRRARTSAERAVAATEQAGLMPDRRGSRAPLDVTVEDPDEAVARAPKPASPAAPARASGRWWIGALVLLAAAAIALALAKW